MALKEVVRLGEFTEKRKTGEEITFVVETAPPEMAEEIVNFMAKWFIPREPMTNCGVNGDPVSVNSLRGDWREIALDGTAMVALKTVEGQTPQLIGANMTYISLKDHDDETCEGEPYIALNAALGKLNEKAQIYEKYGIDKYLGAYGLCVDTDHSGFNVGLRILECRRALCKVLDLPATGTVFSAPASQHLARKAGFEILAEMDFADCVVDGKKPFEKLPGKMYMMALDYR